MVIAALIRIDASITQCPVALTLELRRQARVALAVGLVRTVRAVRIAVAQQ